MSDWTDFLTRENFSLAWQRVLRSQHYENKDRIGLRVFSANLEVNIAYLADQIRQQIYEPNKSEKIYMPKSAGTLRSLPILTIADRLVYQGIGNIIACRTKGTFEAITDGHVFAHILGDVSSPFMLKRWNGQHRKFIEKFQHLWSQGNSWLVEADLASYYDTVDHELLCSELRNRWRIDEQLLKLLTDCLRSWSSHGDGSSFTRGLPQGYETSDYLSTLFLLRADEKMIQSGHIAYIRYVDDIRILAANRESASQSLIRLDSVLKEQALVLQPAKTGAREITDITNEVDQLLNTLSMIDVKRRYGLNVDAEIENLLFRSWYKLEDDKRAESRLIFALNRVSLSRPTRDLAIQMLHRLYWRSNTITNYLSKFVDDEEVIRILILEIKHHRLYGWHIANCIRALASICRPTRYRAVCQEIVSEGLS